MRSRSPLPLMEQLVMVLVFALAAALCLQAFAFADRMSVRNRAVDRAVVECQRAAEILKMSGDATELAQMHAADRLGGHVADGWLTVYYNEEWTVVENERDCAYLLTATGKEQTASDLSGAEIRVVAQADGTELFGVNVVWREVTGHG